MVFSNFCSPVLVSVLPGELVFSFISILSYPFSHTYSTSVPYSGLYLNQKMMTVNWFPDLTNYV